MPATSRRRASSRWPAPSATSAATPQSPAGSTPSRAGSASRSGAEASSPLREEESLDAPGTDVAQHLADPRPNPEQTATNRELATALTHAIDALEPSQREVLVLRDVEGLSAPEVAKILGMSVEAVKSRLHRARVAIREELAPALGRPAIAPPRGALCPDVLTLFSQHLEGEIDPSVCATMEAHLAQCHHCRDACESLKRTLAICRQLPTPDVPASLAASVKAAIHAFLNQRKRGRKEGGGGGGGGVGGVRGGGFIVWWGGG